MTEISAFGYSTPPAALGAIAFFVGLFWLILSYEEYYIDQPGPGLTIQRSHRWRVSTAAIATTLFGAAVVAFELIATVV
jgi:hypothetical protein